MFIPIPVIITIIVIVICFRYGDSSTNLAPLFFVGGFLTSALAIYGVYVIYNLIYSI